MTESYWQSVPSELRHAPLDRDLTVDVAIVGGGNTGIAAAAMMKRSGLKVALLERDRFGAADTAHTSAHLTHVTDLRVAQLYRKLGKDHAAAVWDAGLASIQWIESTAHREGIRCDYARIPGFIAASLAGGKDERDELREEAKLARELGFDASYVEATPLFERPGIRFPNQARIHPLKYLRGLLETIPGDGSYAFEGTNVEAIAGDKLQIQANGKTISADRVFIATDVPLQGKAGLVDAAFLQSKIAPYTSYVVGAKVPKGTAPDVLVWDTADPYHYYRLARGEAHDCVVFGGADHKTGQDDNPQGRFDQIEKVLRGYLPDCEIQYRWSGQVIEAVDGLPFIGETAPHQFMATGFSGNGLTFGTVAAMMACDWALGRSNPWSELFSPSRTKLGAAWNYLKENVDYPYYMLKDRLKRAEGSSPKDIAPGEGRILKIDGQRLAVHRSAAGTLTTLSAVCPHMGCLVHWNSVETTWDCPCHGSRFQATGEVLAGPAESALEPIDIPTEE